MTPELTIRALGTQVRASGHGALAALREIMRLEGLLTRFRPSPLTELNRAARLVAPPSELRRALEHALQVAQETRGWITPTVLPALEAAGYTTAPGAGAVQAAQAVPEIRGIRVTAQEITLPAGVTLDLGGTGKGWIAREAARHLSGHALLDAGGDLMVQATRRVTIGIETPTGPPMYLNLPAGRHGVATSSVLKRAWAGAHHLIDPRTGASARTPFVQVTAVTADVTVAEVLTKLALLNAHEVLRQWLGRFPQSRLLAFDQAGQPHVLKEGWLDAHRNLTWERWAA